MQPEPVDDLQGTVADASTAAGLPPPDDGVLDELQRTGQAAGHLLAAQWDLLKAEFGLARSATVRLLVAGAVALWVATGTLLTVLALVAVALAGWLDSWLGALSILAGLQLVLLGGLALLCRRCLRCMRMAESRGQWQALVGDIKGRMRGQERGNGP